MHYSEQRAIQIIQDLLGFAPSKYQLDFVLGVVNNDTQRHLMLSAVAGAGKTTTLIMAVACLLDVNPRTRITIMSFNRKIKQEMEAKLRRLRLKAEVKTANALGFAAIRKTYGARVGNDTMQAKKYADLALVALREAYPRGFMNPKGIRVGYIPRPLANAIGMIADLVQLEFSQPAMYARYIANPKPTQAQSDYVAEVCQYIAAQQGTRLEMHPEHLEFVFGVLIPKMLRDGALMTPRYRKEGATLSFGEQILLPLIEQLPMEECDVLMVDEAQDLNPAMQELVRAVLARGGYGVFIGDPAQSIYAFSGADSWAIPTLADNFGINADSLYTLPISQRASCMVAAYARNYVAYFSENSNRAHDGKVHFSSSVVQLVLTGELGRGHMVVSRIRESLGRLFFELLTAQSKLPTARRVPVWINGFSLKEMIGKVADDIILFAKLDPANLSIEDDQRIYHDALLYLPDWVEKERRIASKRHEKSEMQRAEAWDLIELNSQIFKTCYESIATYANPRNMTQFKAQLDSLQGEAEKQTMEHALTLSTSHAAKGLETEKLFIYDVDKYKYREGLTPLQIEQENNLRYVSITRSSNIVYTDASQQEFADVFGRPRPFDTARFEDALANAANELEVQIRNARLFREAKAAALGLVDDADNSENVPDKLPSWNQGTLPLD